MRLCYWRRFRERRQSISAVVIAAGQQELHVRLPVGDGREVEAAVPVSRSAAKNWHARLEQGPSDPQEPDFDDPAWNLLPVSYSSDESPQVMTIQQIEDSETQPTVLATTGLLLLAIFLLAVVPSVLLCLLGVMSAVVALAFTWEIGRVMRSQRRTGSGELVGGGIFGFGCAAFFMGVSAALMIYAGLHW
ncbi:hypothetical protein ACWCQZ_51420 [Streptomyces sp. NPDC002285]